MTTPRIEEKKGRKIGEDEYTEHWSLDGHSYIQVPKWVITQAHQAGKQESEEDIRLLTDEIDALRDELNMAHDTIKALQDNK